MIKGAKVAEPAELLRIDLQLFAEGEGGSGAAAGGDAGSSPSTATSSIIPGDDYASGGPEAPDNQPAERVDFEGYNFGEEPEGEEPPESDTDTGEPEQPEEPEVPEPIKKEQSPEANAAFAEMRRKAEEAERVLRERDAWVEQNFGQSHGIKTWEQYQAAIEQTHKQQEAARQQELQQRPQMVYQQAYQKLIEQGYDQEVAHRLATNEANNVANTLETQVLREELAAIRRQEQERQAIQRQQAQKQQQEAMLQQLTQAFLADYGKLQKEFGDLAPTDLAKIDQETVEKIRHGYSLYDAWYTTNRAKIAEQREKAASQKTLNNLNSKKHLKTEGDGAGDSNASTIPLPADTLQMYMDSGMTEKQARAFHKKLYG